MIDVRGYLFLKKNRDLLVHLTKRHIYVLTARSWVILLKPVGLKAVVKRVKDHDKSESPNLRKRKEREKAKKM